MQVSVKNFCQTLIITILVSTSISHPCFAVKTQDVSKQGSATSSATPSEQELDIEAAIPIAADSENLESKSCCKISTSTLATGLLIAGGIMYGVCKNDACSNPNIDDAGKAMMIAGGAVIGATICCICSFACLAAVAHSSK